MKLSYNRFIVRRKPAAEGEGGGGFSTLDQKLADFSAGKAVGTSRTADPLKPASSGQPVDLGLSPEGKKGRTAAKAEPFKAAPEPEVVATQEEDEEEESEEEDDADLGLPTFGKAVAEEEGDEEESEEEDEGDEEAAFDESQFDAATQAVLKALEEKGHPGSAYKQLRAELKELKRNGATPKAVQEELTTLRTKASEADKIKEELEGLRERNKALAARHDELMLTESEEYQEQVQKPLDEIGSTLQEIAKSSGLEFADLAAIITEADFTKQDALLEKLEGKLPRRWIDRMGRFADDYRGVMAKKEAMHKNAGDVMARQRAGAEEAARKQAETRRAAFQSATRNSFEQYAAKIPGLTDDLGQLTAEGRSARARSVAVDPESFTPDDLGYAVFAVEMLPRLIKQLKSQDKELSLLKAGTNAGKTTTVATTRKAKATTGKHGNFLTLEEKMSQAQLGG